MMRFLIACCFALFCASSVAQVATVPASTVYTSVYGGHPPGSYVGVDCCGENPVGKAPCGFTPDADTLVLLMVGQSLLGNNVNGTSTPTHTAQICNYNPYDGKLYADGPRLLGTLNDAGESSIIASISGNTLNVYSTTSNLSVGETLMAAGVSTSTITAFGTGTGGTGSYTISGVPQTVGPESMIVGVCLNPDATQCRDNVARFIAERIWAQYPTIHFNKIVLAPISFGGSLAAPWAIGGVLAPHLAGVIASMIVHGLTPNAVNWGQGESDCQIGTTQTDYFNAVTGVIAGARAAGLPSTVPWIITLETGYMISGGSPIFCPSIRAAQLALVNPADNIFNGADFDTNIPFSSDCRLLPSSHLTGGTGICGGGIVGGGAAWAGNLIARKLHASGAF
jgi:hypothetical protein